MLKKFLHHVLPGVIKPLRIVWNQVIGFLFLVFAVFSAREIYRSYMEANIVRLLISGFFGALMTWFGISSFWRARKISRS
jgi:hypothetical protein